MDSKVTSWWTKLKEKERQLLITLLYHLNLEEYNILINPSTKQYEKNYCINCLGYNQKTGKYYNNSSCRKCVNYNKGREI